MTVMRRALRPSLLPSHRPLKESLLPPRITGAKGGGKGGGKKQKASVVEDDSVRSKSIARIIDIYSEGETGGLLTGDAKSIYIVDGTSVTPVMNDDGSLNFEGITFVERTGTPDQAYVSGYPAVEYESTVGVEFKTASPVSRTIDDLDLDAVRVKIRIPQIYVVDGSGDIRRTRLQFAIDRMPDGGSFTEIISADITEKSESPYELEYRIELPAGEGPWTIRCRRITTDSTAKRVCDSYWSSFTGVIDAKLSRPNTAYIALAVDAQQFASDNIPGRAYKVLGIKIEVPTNYDPVTRVYETTGPGTTGGIWDGTFKRAVCGNPAWVLRDLVTNKRYGCGDHIDATQVDKWTLYEIAQYCDEMVDDGKGGTEPRYVIRTQINSQESAYSVLQAVASAFRGYVYWGAGDLPLTCGQDRPADVTKIYGPGNVIGGIFNREEVDVLARHTVALVTWNDPDDGHKPAVEMVTDDEGLQDLGWKPIQVAAFGCDDQGRAHRLGKWILDTEKNEGETVTFTVGLFDADVVPGEIIHISDPVMAGFRGYGRIVSGTTTSATIDAAVDLIFGEAYTLTIVLADGSLSAEIPLTNAAGSATVLTWTTPLGTAPAENHGWIVSSAVAEPEPWRVIKIAETDKHLFEITALRHDPTKYARVEQGINLQPASYSLLPSGALKAPKNLSATGYIFQNGASPLVNGLFSWTPPTDSRVTGYEINVQLPGDDAYSVSAITEEVSFVVENIATGDVGFRVRALSGAMRSAWVEFTDYLTPLSERPAQVENFTCTVLSDVATLRWDTAVDFDIAYYQIKFQPVLTGATWESAIDLEPAAQGPRQDVAAMVGTYLIKAVDILGQPGITETTVVNRSGGLSYFNVVETITEDPGFSGTKTDVVFDIPLDGLILDGAATTGTYEFATDIDLGAVFTSRITVSMTVGGVNQYADFFEPADFFAVEDFFQAASGSWSVELQARTTLDDPAGSPVTWTAWLPLMIGDLTFRGAEFRLILNSFAEGVTPLVTALSVTVDMPDRSVKVINATIPVTGYTLVIDPPMKESPLVSFTPRDFATGDYFLITSVSASGFTVTCYDSTDTAIERHGDPEAKGWGLEA